jgi:aspartate/methionine/tyrosine aminotransferase
VAQARARGQALIDLTESNPTVVGLRYPEALIREALADAAALRYEPTPKGLLSARAAVAAYYRRHQRVVDPERITLTASTSEAYSWLFKLLCDPGDEVLVPTPSYPLFEHLAGLEAVRVTPYPLRYHGGWFLDVEEVARVLTARSRAVLVVNPNNPTGSFLRRGEHARLQQLCAERDLALISDEVFADYAFAPDGERVTTLVDDDATALTFCLSGLSKLVGLPQLKLGWIVLGGPPARRAAAEARLELIADTYLSVGAPVQHAAPRLLQLVDDVGAQIAARVRDNRDHLAAALRGAPANLLASDGGWSAIVRLPAIRSEEEWVLSLLDAGVLVHPGFFYDLAGTHAVLSLLAPFDRLRDGIAAIVRECTY